MFLDGPADEADQGTGLDTFMYLVKGVGRCVDAGRFPLAPTDDPAELAVEVWGLEHGLVTLQLAHLLPPLQVVRHLNSGVGSLFKAWGDDPAALHRSAASARRRILSSLT